MSASNPYSILPTSFSPVPSMSLQPSTDTLPYFSFIENFLPHQFADSFELNENFEQVVFFQSIQSEQCTPILHNSTTFTANVLTITPQSSSTSMLKCAGKRPNNKIRYRKKIKSLKKI